MDNPVSRMTNPMLRRLSKIEAQSTGETASYAGIVIKTLYFLVSTVIGVFLYFIVNKLFENAGATGVQAEGISFYTPELYILIGAVVLAIATPFFARRFLGALPVLGTIYALCQGYLIGFGSNLYEAQYQGIVVLALGLTVLVILAMLAIYSTGKVKVTGRFRTVLTTLLAVMIVGSLLVFLSSLIFPNNTVVRLVYDNSVLAIVIAAAGVLIAALFLLSDFDTIRRTVEQQLPRPYEWYAAFGLAITVLWLYLKILSLIARIMGRSK